MQGYLTIAAGIGFIFLMSIFGAATVFIFRKDIPPYFKKVFLGFASGVMLAAAIWSLILPSMDDAQALGIAAWIPAAIGVVLGACFMLALDYILPKLRSKKKANAGTTSKSDESLLFILAVILHDIPEGMAVGLSFAFAVQSGDPAALTTAIALALGVGIQNFPEAAAISLPLRQEGMPAKKAFKTAVASGAVEPIFSLIAIAIGVFLAAAINAIMPWLLAFAAGAIIYVVLEELVPESHEDKKSHLGTLSALAGFLLMMILDSALG